jgi:hypothetical protein
MSEVMIRDARLAFPNLFEAKTVNGEGDPAFSCTLLIAKDDPVLKAIAKIEDDLAAAKWGDKAGSILKTIRSSGKGAVKDGATKAEYDGFDGMMFVSCRSKTRPSVFDRDRSPLVAADGKPYGGCYVNAKVSFWAQDNAYGKRINAQISGVQFSKDGDNFGGGVRAAVADDFADLSADGEDDPLA